MPDELMDWLEDRFKVVSCEIDGKTFTFNTDVSIEEMMEHANEIKERMNSEISDVDKTILNMRQMIVLCSIEPKITWDHVVMIPARIIKKFWETINQKKAQKATPKMNTESISSVKS